MCCHLSWLAVVPRRMFFKAACCVCISLDLLTDACLCVRVFVCVSYTECEYTYTLTTYNRAVLACIPYTEHRAFSSLTCWLVMSSWPSWVSARPPCISYLLQIGTFLLFSFSWFIFITPAKQRREGWGAFVDFVHISRTLFARVPSTRPSPAQSLFLIYPVGPV